MKFLTGLFTFLIFLLLCFVFSNALILDETQCIARINGKCKVELRDESGFILSKYIPFYEPNTAIGGFFNNKSIHNI